MPAAWQTMTQLSVSAETRRALMAAPPSAADAVKAGGRRRSERAIGRRSERASGVYVAPAARPISADTPLPGLLESLDSIVLSPR